jgi:hypothetical protein
LEQLYRSSKLTNSVARSVPLTPPGLGSTTWSTPSLPIGLYPLFGRRPSRAMPERGLYEPHFSCFRQWPE